MILEITQNGEVVSTRELTEGSLKIGRSSQCDIQLSSPQVSKQHALLVMKGDKLAIVDLGSSNGVFVNGILIKKQRISLGDEISIANYKLRVLLAARAPQKEDRIELGQAFDGNAAVNLDAQPMAEAPLPIKSPQEKFLQLVDDKLLVPFYELMKNLDWRFILGGILVVALVASVILSSLPIIDWGRRITSREALGRAHTILAQTVRENYRLLSKSNEVAMLTVEACEAEKGMLSCFIVEPRNATIMAPTKLLNQTLSDRYSLLALEQIKNKEEIVSIEAKDNVWVVAQPIEVFDPDLNDRVLNAAVVASFQIDSSATSTFEPLVEACLIALVLSLGAYFMIFKMISRPVLRMQEQLDAALKGDDVAINPEVKFNEMENLAQVINFSVARLKQSGAGLATAVDASDPEVEDNMYVKSVTEFDEITTDALLVLNPEKIIKFVGRAMEDLLSMRDSHAKGQNISDACRDPSFAGTAIDLVDRVIGSLGQTQNAQLEFNGVNRSVGATAHKNTAGEIRFVLITVKLGEG